MRFCDILRREIDACVYFGVQPGEFGSVLLGIHPPQMNEKSRTRSSSDKAAASRWISSNVMTAKRMRFERRKSNGKERGSHPVTATLPSRRRWPRTVAVPGRPPGGDANRACFPSNPARTVARDSSGCGFFFFIWGTARSTRRPSFAGAARAPCRRARSRRRRILYRSRQTPTRRRCWASCPRKAGTCPRGR